MGENPYEPPEKPKKSSALWNAVSLVAFTLLLLFLFRRHLEQLGIRLF